MPPKMPWYLKYSYVMLNFVMVWPTRRSNEEKLREILARIEADEQNKNRGGGADNVRSNAFCCALYWPEVSNKSDEYHTMPNERACQNLVDRNPYSDYRKNLPPGPCVRG